MSITNTTRAAALRQSPRLQAALDTIEDEVRQHRANITQVQPPLESLRVEYQDHLDRTAAVRGRGLLYPYLSSGLGNGALVELEDGSVKWDLISGIGVHFFGHSHPQLTRCALEGALDNTVKHGNLQTGFAPTQFSETLLREAQKSSRLRYSFLSTSGAMANENALKIALQKHAPACRIVAFAHCFMGRSIVMSQIGDSPGNRQGIPLNVHVDYLPFWDSAAVARVGKTRFIDMAVWHLEQYFDRYPGQHACVIFELVQGEGGFNVGDRDFFKALMELCKERNVAVWDDEIQTFGRTESMFAYDLFGLGDYVDVFCVGKMTHACATLFTEEYNPKPGLLSGTFTGEGVSFAVGQRILELLRDGDFYGPEGHFAQHHAAFRTQVEALRNRHPEWFPAVKGITDVVGGTGGMMRFTPFGGQKDRIGAACKAIFDEGAVTFWCGHGPYHIRLLPPLPVMKLEDWPSVFATIERGLAQA